MSDSEYEEEEFLVYADFKNQLLPDELSDPNFKIKIIGIETKNPVAEINGSVFQGKYDYAMGTNVFFDKDDTPANVKDPLFENTCKQRYKFLGKTTKVINFKRTSVARKPEETKTDNQETEEVSAAAEDDLKINMTLDEVIQQFPTFNEN